MFITTKIIIGSGSLCSATKGADTVHSLAKKLQIPIAEAAKSVGNRSRLQTKTKLNVPQTPNFAIKINKGNKSTI